MHRSWNPQLCLLSNSLVHLDRHRRLQLEQILAEGGGQLLMYLDIARYDETPVTVAHHQVLERLSGPHQAEHAQQAPPQEEAAGSNLGSASLSMRSTSVSKMLSTEQKFAALIKISVPQDIGEPQPQLVSIIGSTLCWNQLLARGSGQCIYSALRQTRAVSHHTEKYLLKCRVTTTDAAGANSTAERLIASQQDHSWAQLHLPCNVHKAARCLGRSLEPLEQHVSGMVNVALSLNLGPLMLEFRKAICEVVAKRPLLIQRGPVPFCSTCLSTARPPIVWHIWQPLGREDPLAFHSLHWGLAQDIGAGVVLPSWNGG